MAYSAILTVPVFLLLVFAVERVCARLCMPSVIEFVGLGFIAKPLLGLFGYHLDGVHVLAPATLVALAQRKTEISNIDSSS